MWNLAHKKVLLTGGTRGIGRASVEVLAGLGAEVLFTARNKQELDQVSDELNSKGHRVQAMVADVRNARDRANISQWIREHWGKLDILVNNAGMNIRKPSDAYTESEYDQVLDTNLHAPFRLIIELLPLLKTSGRASIINVASIAGLMDAGTGSPYGIAKAGLIQLTRNLAVEMAGEGIRVNAVSPWFTETPLTQGLRDDVSKISRVLQRTPINRIARPLEIANVISFLAMEQSSYITGQNIVADGGMSAGAL